MEDAGRSGEGVRKRAPEAKKLLTRIALDSNVVVALLQAPTAQRQALSAQLGVAAQRGDHVLIPYTCIGETWRTLTEPRGYAVPPEAVDLMLRRLLRSLEVLFPTARALARSFRIAAQLNPTGAEIFDVQIAALCIEHKVSELWTYDRAFPALPELRIVPPGP